MIGVPQVQQDVEEPAIEDAPEPPVTLLHLAAEEAIIREHMQLDLALVSY